MVRERPEFCVLRNRCPQIGFAPEMKWRLRFMHAVEPRSRAPPTLSPDQMTLLLSHKNSVFPSPSRQRSAAAVED